MYLEEKHTVHIVDTSRSLLLFSEPYIPYVRIMTDNLPRIQASSLNSGTP